MRTPVHRCVLFVLCCFMITALSAAVVHWRDSGYGGPHHDEVIALMASNALERDYGIIKKTGAAPIGVIVPAAEWQKWTSFRGAVPFRDIAEDVLENDKHPPLSFWLLNRWLSLFEHGAYQQAVWLSWLQILVAAGLLAFAVYRQTESRAVTVATMAIFLLGNSAVFTAAWVRQYSLFACFYSALICCALEYSRNSFSRRVETGIACLIGLTAVGGMLTQYTFVTMSFPIHIALLWTAARRRGWPGFLALSGMYVASATLFLAVLPGAIRHATTVSAGLERKSHWAEALAGLPDMIIPVPGIVPGIVKVLAGAALLVTASAWFLWLVFSEDRSPNQKTRVFVPLVGIVGAGITQVILVGLGFFPAWGTGANHTCALWILICFAGAVTLCRLSPRVQGLTATLVLLMMIGMQALFIWHCHRILPRLNTLYPGRLKPDLVIIDNLARGYVLQVTDVLEPRQNILVADDLAASFRDNGLGRIQKVVYLPMEDSVAQKKRSVMDAAVGAGWSCQELPVIHTGMYEAILIERRVSSADQ